MPSRKMNKVDNDNNPGVGCYNVEKYPKNKPPQYKIGTGNRPESYN